MNIFEQYLDKIKEILSTLSSNGDLILPDSLNGITAEIPPSKFDSDISTNVAMVLSKINNKSPSDLASILAEKIKKEDKFIEKKTKTLSFVKCQVFSKDNLIVSGSGIWKIVNFNKVNNISDKIKKDDGGW